MQFCRDEAKAQVFLGGISKPIAEKLKMGDAQPLMLVNTFIMLSAVSTKAIHHGATAQRQESLSVEKY